MRKKLTRILWGLSFLSGVASFSLGVMNNWKHYDHPERYYKNYYSQEVQAYKALEGNMGRLKSLNNKYSPQLEGRLNMINKNVEIIKKGDKGIIQIYQKQEDELNKSEMYPVLVGIVVMGLSVAGFCICNSLIKKRRQMVK